MKKPSLKANSSELSKVLSSLIYPKQKENLLKLLNLHRRVTNLKGYYHSSSWRKRKKILPCIQAAEEKKQSFMLQNFEIYRSLFEDTNPMLKTTTERVGARLALVDIAKLLNDEMPAPAPDGETIIKLYEDNSEHQNAA